MAFQAPQVLQPSEGAWMSASRIDSGCVASRVHPPGVRERLDTEQTGLLYLSWASAISKRQGGGE